MTLNQVIQQIKKIASQHKQINTFYYGHLSEWDRFTGLTYPSCVLVLNSANLTAREALYSFSMYLVDLLNADANNRNDIQSDTMQVAQDFLSMMGNESQNDWTLDRDGNALTFFDDEKSGDGDNPDFVAGVKMDFSLRTDFVRDWCQVPNRIAIITEQGFTLFTEQGQIINQEESDDEIFASETSGQSIDQETSEKIIKE